MNNVNLALNICTYKREHNLKNNLEVLKNSEFFNPDNPHYYNKLHIFVIDNASELVLEDFPNLHFFHNSNTGGSGGFQRGIEEIRKISGFTHVIFMDDDVAFCSAHRTLMRFRADILRSKTDALKLSVISYFITTA